MQRGDTYSPIAAALDTSSIITMSSLIHPVHSISQKCRPKHQVLVLKCYPKYQKGVQEVKPSSSELSYLLYYASSRRSKLQKVGAFLEKKTAGDVYMRKLGYAQTPT